MHAKKLSCYVMQVKVFLKNQKRSSSQTVLLTELVKRDGQPALLLPTFLVCFTMLWVYPVKNQVALMEVSCSKSSKTEVSKLLANQDRATFISFFSYPGFKLLSWALALQCFGHIPSKHKDAKSEVVSFKNRREVRPIQIMPGGCYYVKRVKQTAEGSIYSRSKEKFQFTECSTFEKRFIRYYTFSHFSTLDTNICSMMVPFLWSLCIIHSLPPKR